MKKILPLLLTLLTFCSCHHKPTAALVQADSLLSAYKVNEAQKMLLQYKSHHERKSLTDSMYYELLCTEAKNKSYHPFSAGADSAFLPTYNYYTMKGSIFQQMRANYLMGCIYRDLGWYTEGQRYLHKAIAISEKDDANTSEKYKLLSRIYGQLGEIYRYRTQIDMSVDMYNQSISCAKEAGDSTMMYSATLQLASCMSSLEDYHSAITNYRKCYQYFSNHHQDEANDCLLQIAGCYILCEEDDSIRKYITAYEKSKNISKPLYLTKDELNNFTYYIYKGDYNYMQDSIRSAIIFYQRLCYAKDKSYHETGYKMLANCYLRLGIKDSIIKYQQLYTEQIIEINELNDSKQLQELNSNFNIISEKGKTYNEWIAKQRIIFFTLLSISILSVICIVFALLYIRKKKKYIKLLLKFRIAIDNLNKQKKITSDLHAHNTKILSKDQVLNLEIAKNNIDIIESQFTDEDLIKARLQQFQTCHIVRKFYSKDKLEESDWQELTDCIHKIAPTLMAFLRKHQFDIEDTDYKMCLLIAVGIPPKIMKSILCCSAQKISMQRRRHLKKFFGIDGKPCEFDYKLRSLKSSDYQHK